MLHSNKHEWEVRSEREQGDLCAEPTHPGKSLAEVECAVIAWSCSPSYAKEWAKAIQAGANLESIRLALLQQSALAQRCI